MPEALEITGEALGTLVTMVAEGRVSRQSAREAFAYAFQGGEDIEGYVRAHGLETVQEDGAYRKAVEEVLSRCRNDADAYRAGNEKALGFLIGQAMKAFQGKPDPKRIREALMRALKA